MPNLDAKLVDTARRGLEAADLDAWLLYDFRAKNPIAARLVGLPEGQKRRWFVLIRPGRPPVALVQRIEVSGWDGWPHEFRSYVSSADLESALGELLEGCATVAMEVSPDDAIPYVDHVPAGVRELVESLGPRVVSSVDLVSGTAAQWGASGLETHLAAAEILARVARGAFELAARAVGLDAAPAEDTAPAEDVSAAPPPSDEHRLAEWVRAELAGAGLIEGDTIIAVGPNAAKPHYGPEEGTAAALEPGQVFMVDLWGKRGDDPAAVYADQTWMGYLGPEPPEDVVDAWEAAVAAREAAIDAVRADPGATGADADRAARAVLIERGYEDGIFHRTGHGIDTDIHGVGPTLDSIETHDDRRLVPGIGFSVEPGVYLEGRFGIRTEVDVYMRDDGPLVTPSRVQRRLWVTR